MKKQSKNKSLEIKKQICEALEGRKEKEDKIITLFFGKGETRKEGKKKFSKMYNTITKNLRNMDLKKLDDIAKGIDDLINLPTFYRLN